MNLTGHNPDTHEGGGLSILELIPERWHEFARFLDEVYTRIRTDCLPLAAGSISYFTVLSLIPLLIFLVTIAPTFISPNELKNFADAFGQDFASALNAQFLSIIKRRYELRSVALLLMLWTGSQVFLILEMAINMIWRSQKRRSYWVRRGLALGMVIIMGTLLATAMLLTNMISVLGSLEIPLWGHSVSDIPLLTKLTISLLIPTLLVTTIFALVYYLLPTRRVTFQSVVPGAVFAGVLWAISLHLFGWYLHSFRTLDNVKVVYGALWGLALLLVWFYYSAFIMLLGAEISAVYHRWLARAGDARERMVDQQNGPLPETTCIS